MTDFRKRFLESRDELKKVRSITLCAMLAAMGMALSYFTIRISPSFQIGFSGIANLMIGYLFGPVMAPCAGIVTDVLNYIESFAAVINNSYTTINIRIALHNIS